MANRILKWAAIGAAVVLSAAPARAQVSFFGTGSDVMVKYMGCEASFTSDLLFGFTVGGISTPLFNCHGSTAGQEVNIGPIASGTEVIFSLFVHDQQQTYYTGAGSRNPDGLIHVSSFAVSDGVYTRQFGFEDTFGGGDMDFNDTNFRIGGVSDISVTPEPSSLILAASGLGFLGLGGLRRRRNRA